MIQQQFFVCNYRNARGIIDEGDQSKHCVDAFCIFGKGHIGIFLDADNCKNENGDADPDKEAAYTEQHFDAADRDQHGAEQQGKIAVFVGFSPC